MLSKQCRTTILISAAVAMAIVAALLRIGRFSPREKIETLQHPIAVTGWNSDGLSLADGRTAPIPGLRLLPRHSAALAETTQRGVEIHAGGRIWGLVRIHHWCGNDPVQEHIARIDLSDMVTFLRVGEPVIAVPETGISLPKPDGTFSESGWSIGEFLDFQTWQSIKDSSR